MSDVRPRFNSIGGRQKRRIAYTQPAIGGFSTAVRRQRGLSESILAVLRLFEKGEFPDRKAFLQIYDSNSSFFSEFYKNVIHFSRAYAILFEAKNLLGGNFNAIFSRS